MNRFFPHALPVAGLSLLLALPVPASQTPLAGTADEATLDAEDLVSADGVETFSETVDVHVVDVEVVVTDERGVPVTGLTRGDFEIFEDGEPMELKNFFAVEGRAPAPAPPGESPAARAAQWPEQGTRSLEMVIFIDNLQIRPQNRKLLFDRLRDVLRQSAGTDRRFMVATMDRGLRFPLPFTSDVDRVFEVLDEIERSGSLYALYEGERRMFMTRLRNASLRTYQPPPTNVGTRPLPGLGFRAHPAAAPEGDPEFDEAIRVALDLAENVYSLAERRTQQAKSSIEGLRAVCEALAGLPGRKALVYLSDGIPRRPADPLFEAWLGKFHNWMALAEADMHEFTRFADAPAKFQRLTVTGNGAEFDVDRDLDELARQASASRVAIYPISTAGGMSDLVSAEVGGHGLTGIVAPTDGFARAAQVTESFTRDASLLQLAEDTGGVAIVRSPNLAKLLDRVDQDFRSFYSLGYSPPHGGKDAGFHRLEVRLRDGLDFEVRHAAGYHNKTWRRSLGEETLAAALYGRESNPLGVRIDRGEPTPDGKHFRVPIQVKIPFELIRMLHRDEHFAAQLTLLVLVSDEDDGGLSTTRRFDLPIKVPDDEALEAMAQVATYPLELKMNRGRKRIAIGVHDHLGKEMSTIKYDIVLGEEKKASRSRS